MHGAKKYVELNKEYRDIRDLGEILDSLEQAFPGRFTAINDPRIKSLKHDIDAQLLSLQTKKWFVFAGASAAMFVAARVLPSPRLKRFDRFYLTSLFTGIMARKYYLKHQTKKTYEEFKPKFNFYLEDQKYKVLLE